MANETTTTTANDVIRSEIINVAALEMAKERLGVTRLYRPVTLGQGTATYQFWRPQNASGTPLAGGGGVDTEFDATEATDLANTAFSTDQVQIGVSEYGIMRTLTDNILEDGIGGADFVNIVVRDSMRIIMEAIEDDAVALLGDFSNTSGSTTVDLALTDLDDAIVSLRGRGVMAPGGLAFVLNDQAIVDFENAMVSTNAAAAVYANSADSFLDMGRAANNGLSEGAVGRYRGIPIFMSGLTDPANAGADVESALFVPYAGSANSGWEALCEVTKRPMRFESERNASLRGTEYVATARVGHGELNDDFGQTIISDA